LVKGEVRVLPKFGKTMPDREAVEKSENGSVMGFGE
jgi:hypothetical protein